MLATIGAGDQATEGIFLRGLLLAVLLRPAVHFQLYRVIGTNINDWLMGVAGMVQAFLQEAKATGVYEMYYIELATGLRRGELLGLKWTDIDWKNGIIKVRRQVARVNGEIVEAPLKTKNSYRAVSISPQAIEVLREQKRKTNDQYVFPSPNGGPISPDSVNNMLKRVLERAGIPKVRFHDLRHTFATIALQNGVDIKTVSGMLGHFSAGFTLDTYAHVTTSAQKEAAQTMGNILSL